MTTLLLLLGVCAAGALLAHRLDPLATRGTDHLALGAPVGLALFSGYGFLLGSAFGLSTATVLGAGLLTAATGGILGSKPGAVLAALRPRGRAGLGLTIACLLSAALVTRLADRTLFLTDTGLATGDRHNFGDLPFHMAIAAGFAYGNNFPPQHPELSGVPLTYPFFCDLLSGMILTVGGSWRAAFFWPSLILGLSVVAAVARFGEAVTGSRALGRVGAGLTFFSGGLGFAGLTSLQRLREWWTVGPDLTIDDAGMRYANVVTTMFIPQRSILFGWPLLFFALALMVRTLRRGDEVNDAPPTWRRAGIIVSLLPLVHSHSFAVAGYCFLFLAIPAGLKAAQAFFLGVTPLAAPAVLFMLTRNSLSTGQFLAWQPGFDGGADHPLRYWLMNAGVFLPLVIAGIVRCGAPPARRLFAAPLASLFILALLFRLSPWIWDNMKFLAPAHAGLAPFASLALGSLWLEGRWGRAGALILFGLATLSGALDVSKVALAGGEYGLFNQTDLLFAEKVRAATPAATTILTAPVHNHPALLSGRRLFLGYEGHLWSQGLDYAARKPVAEAMFRGEVQPAADPAMIHVDAIALTPAERSVIPDPLVFTGFPSLVDSPYRLFKVR